MTPTETSNCNRSAEASFAASGCSVCGRTTTNFPAWDKRKWACRPCWNGYVAFRRAYKAEHGHYPTIQDFRE